MASRVARATSLAFPASHPDPLNLIEERDGKKILGLSTKGQLARNCPEMGWYVVL